MKTILVLGLIALAASANAQTLSKFERALPQEDELRKEIVRGIMHIQEENKLDGRKLRGTHAKGICARAKFEIYAGSDSRLQGIFKHSGTYPATVRFANAASKIESDQTPDVRSLSFAVEMPASISNPQGRIDFSMNNAPTFPINDSDVFAAIMVLARKGLVSGGWEIGYSRLMKAKEAFSLGEAQKAPAEKSYQLMRYWSGVPFLMGENQAVKYALSPGQINQGQKLGAGADALSEELIRNLSQDLAPPYFDFEVQFLNESMKRPDGSKPSLTDWVENATWEWPAAQAPYVRIGRLTLEKNSSFTGAECEAQKFSVNLNTNMDHRGIGSINRGRTWAEKASADKR